MNARLLITNLILIHLFSCNTSQKKIPEEIEKSDIDYLQTPKSITADKSQDLSNPKRIKPVYGDRFIITGDFDGDGKKEKLTEHFISGINNKETYKWYEVKEDSLDYGNWTSGRLVLQSDALSCFICDNPNIDTLIISRNGTTIGPYFVKNEGDLNGDGADEVSYVPMYTGLSNLTSYNIMTLKHKKWKMLYGFTINRDDVPGYGEDASKFKPLVRKLNNNRIKLSEYDPNDYGIITVSYTHLTLPTKA